MQDSVPNMFSMARSKPHSDRKRIVSNVYSKSFLQSSSELQSISRVMIHGRLIPLLAKVSANEEPVDVLDLNYASTMDFVTAYIFGLANCTNFIEDVKSRQEWLRVYSSRRPFSFWDAELPSLKTMSAKVGLPIVPPWVSKASRQLEAWTLRHCKSAEKSGAEAKNYSMRDVLDTPPIVHQQLFNSFPDDSADSKHPKELKVATELHDHLAAGHETSGITLTYLFYELSLNPALQAALRAEVLSLTPALIYSPSSTTQDVPSSRSIDSLPLLHACLMETLRIHAAIPGPQPRITPFPPVSLAGSPPLPPGVRVSAQPYSLHRNREVFPDPEVWKPARWIDANEAQRNDMSRWFWAFGSGGRMCVGSHFAMQGQCQKSARILLMMANDARSSIPCIARPVC